MIFEILFSTLLFLGLYFIVCNICRVPKVKTSKAIISVANKSKVAGIKDVILNDFIALLSRYIKLNEYRREALLRKLYSANINDTPEIFIAKALVKPIIMLIQTVILLLIAPILSILTLGVCISYYFR